MPKWLIALIAVVAGFVLGYPLGALLTLSERRQAQTQLDEVKMQLAELQDKNAQLESQSSNKSNAPAHPSPPTSISDKQLYIGPLDIYDPLLKDFDAKVTDVIERSDGTVDRFYELSQEKTFVTLIIATKKNDQIVKIEGIWAISTDKKLKEFRTLALLNVIACLCPGWDINHEPSVVSMITECVGDPRAESEQTKREINNNGLHCSVTWAKELGFGTISIERKRPPQKKCPPFKYVSFFQENEEDDDSLIVLYDLNYKPIKKEYGYVDISWKVGIKNKDSRDHEFYIKCQFIDVEKMELDYTNETVQVPANSQRIVTGVESIKEGLFDKIADMHVSAKWVN